MEEQLLRLTHLHYQLYWCDDARAVGSFLWQWLLAVRHHHHHANSRLPYLECEGGAWGT